METLTFPRIIVLSALRLWSLSRTLSDPDYTLALADTEIWTQFELHYNVVSATIPCLRIFLRAFHTDQLTHMISIHDESGVPSNAATKGQSSAPLSSIIAAALGGSNWTGQDNDEISTFEEKVKGYGKTESSAMRNEGKGIARDEASMASDWSERAIVVKQTVDVHYADD